MKRCFALVVAALAMLAFGARGALPVPTVSPITPIYRGAGSNDHTGDTPYLMSGKVNSAQNYLLLNKKPDDGAQHFGRERLVNLQKAVASNAPVSWLFIGDSIASWNNPGNQTGLGSGMFTAFTNFMGLGGAGGVGLASLWYGAISGGATYITAPAGEWFGHVYRLSSDAQMVTWEAPAWKADTLKLWVYGATGAGHLRIQTNTDGFGWGDAYMLNYYDVSRGSPTGLVINVPVPAGHYYGLKAIASGAGVVDVLGAVCRNSQSGFTAIEMDAPGSDLAAFAAVPTNVMGPIIRDLSPTVASFFVYDSPGAVGTNAAAIISLFKTWATNTDILMMGAPPAPDALQNVIDQNDAMRTNAVAAGVPYFDAFGIMGDATAAQAQGLIPGPGDVHPTGAGFQFICDRLWAWLGIGDMGSKQPVFYPVPASAITKSTGLTNAAPLQVKTTYNGANMAILDGLQDNETELFLGVSWDGTRNPIYDASGASGVNWSVRGTSINQGGWKVFTSIHGQAYLDFSSGDSQHPWAKLWPSGGWTFGDLWYGPNHTVDPGAGNLLLDGNVTNSAVQTWNVATNTAPGNTSTVVGWFPVKTTNGVTGYLPIYR